MNERESTRRESASVKEGGEIAGPVVFSLEQIRGAAATGVTPERGKLFT